MSWIRLEIAIWLLIGSMPLQADILHFKNGGRIECDEAWIEGDTVCYRISEGTLGFPLPLLEHIEKTDAPAISSSPRPPLPPEQPVARPWRPLPVDTKNPAYRRAEEALARRDYEAAIQALTGVESLPAGLMLGYAYTRLRRYQMALTVLEPYQVQSSDNADLNYLLGECHYNLGHDEQAIKYLEQSLHIEDNPAIRDLLERIQRQNAIIGSTDFLRSTHFLLRYDRASDARLAQRILDVLENSFVNLQKVLSFSPEEEIQVIVSGRRQFYDITRAPEWSLGINDGRIFLSIGGIDDLNDVLERSISHELAHTFLHDLTHGNTPVWLNEGLAMYLTGENQDDYTQILAQRASADNLIPLAALQSSFKGFAGAESAELAYAEALLATNYLVSLYGFNELNRLLGLLAQGIPFEEALHERYKLDVLELERKVKEFLLSAAARYPSEGIRVR